MVLKSTSSGTQKFQLWYLKVPAVVLKSTSSGTRSKLVIFPSLRPISFPSPQCLSVPSPKCFFVPSAKFPPFVSLKILRKYANLTHNLTHHKHLIISCKDTKCVRFGDFLLNFITRYCTRASFITFIARGRLITTGGDEEGEE